MGTGRPLPLSPSYRWEEASSFAITPLAFIPDAHPDVLEVAPRRLVGDELGGDVCDPPGRVVPRLEPDLRLALFPQRSPFPQATVALLGDENVPSYPREVRS